MALWGPASTTTSTRPRIGPRGTIAKLTPGWQYALRQLHELPVIARYAGHLFVAVLLIATLRDAFAGVTGAPTADTLAMGGVAASASYHPSIRARSGEGVLEAAVLPSTNRALRGVIQPLFAPQRGVRTSVTTYEVQANDTVLGIAQRFGLSGNSILWANDRLAENPDFLSIGQELNILPVDGALHTVASGETAEAIADKYKVDPGAITRFAGNNLAPPYTLEAGQQLVIPGGTKPYVARVISYAGASAPSTAQRATGSYLWPMSGRISQGYWSAHLAIDIAAPLGTPIYAVDNGYVKTSQWSDVGYGRMVIVDHGDGTQTLYAHMSTYYVSPGEAVTRGQQIGICGSTGNSTGPHLHFEVIRNGVRGNPFAYLP
jgi:murein DD-endopeptidase MepM/ murein hydrolase activator NlpD